MNIMIFVIILLMIVFSLYFPLIKKIFSLKAAKPRLLCFEKKELLIKYSKFNTFKCFYIILTRYTNLFRHKLLIYKIIKIISCFIYKLTCFCFILFSHKEFQVTEYRLNYIKRWGAWTIKDAFYSLIVQIELGKVRRVASTIVKEQYNIISIDTSCVDHFINQFLDELSKENQLSAPQINCDKTTPSFDTASIKEVFFTCFLPCNIFFYPLAEQLIYLKELLFMAVSSIQMMYLS